MGADQSKLPTYEKLIKTLKNNQGELDIYFKKYPTEINKRNHNDLNLLMYFCKFCMKEGSLLIIEYLINQCIDINATDRFGKTALHHCILTPVDYPGSDIKTNSIKVIKLLVEHQIDLNIQDKMGKTALFYAVKDKLYDIVKILLDAGAKINLVDTYNNSVLKEALNHLNDKMLGLLLEYDNIDHQLIWLALSDAVQSNKLESAELLLKTGINPNQVMEFRYPLLISAAKNKNLSMFLLLLCYGADKNMTDTTGKTAFDHFPLSIVYQKFITLIEKEDRMTYLIMRTDEIIQEE